MGTTENRGRFEVEQPKVGPKGESRPWGRSRTESLGGLKDPGGWAAARETAEGSPKGKTPRAGANQQQPEVGPKGAASGAMQVKDCREAAPKEEQVGKTCESNERERTSQIKTAAQGGAWASQAGAAFSNPFTSELARDSEITSLTRSARGPALAALLPTDGGLFYFSTKSIN